MKLAQLSPLLGLHRAYTVIIFLLVFILCALSQQTLATDSEVSQQNTDIARLLLFYSEATPSAAGIMNSLPPKYSALTGKRLSPNLFLKSEQPISSTSPLIQGAQAKATELFRDANCNVLRKRFPGLNCKTRRVTPDRWASAQRNDKPADLVNTWVDELAITLDSIPVSGEASSMPWSDDYWRYKWGATSYRYLAGHTYSSYKEAVAAYAQPMEWTNAIALYPRLELYNVIGLWSPAEKYDLVTGDETFSLTQAQKRAGESFLGEDGDIESWMGLCHGWAAASMMVPAPMRELPQVGARGVSVHFHPHDIRALATLAWANGNSSNNFIGGRCNTRNVETYENGRLKDQDCFDNNPATFHLVLGNQIGRAKVPFIMDASYDHQVWNQPVYSYSLQYFNPLRPGELTQNWKDVTIPYDAAFKIQDRFQTPLTRGRRIEASEQFDDSAVTAVVGVLAKVTYVGEVYPTSGSARETSLINVTYEYDLEFEGDKEHWTPTGGEWHSNFHPDFLWVPKKGEVASSSYDDPGIMFSGIEIPFPAAARVASRASATGYPLCQVLSALVNNSSQSGTRYRCPLRR